MVVRVKVGVRIILRFMGGEGCCLESRLGLGLSLDLPEGRVVVRVKVGVRIILRFMGGEGCCLESRLGF